MGVGVGVGETPLAMEAIQTEENENEIARR
jgi:hypothetical protein